MERVVLIQLEVTLDADDDWDARRKGARLANAAHSAVDVTRDSLARGGQPIVNEVLYRGARLRRPRR